VPVIAILAMVRIVVPMLVRVTVFAALVTPIATVPNFRLAGTSFAVVPVPDNVTFCGLPLALSVMLIAALRAPEAVGLKSALTVQLAPAAKDAPQVVAVLAKSPALVPVIAIELIVREVVPEFFTVTLFTALVTPIATVPKPKLVGERVTAGPPLRLKVAVTAFAAVIVTLQAAVPVQAPLQPANVEPEPAAGVRVTAVPVPKLTLQVPGQLMPLGLLVTFPAPVPATVTVSAKDPDETFRKTVSKAKSESTQLASPEPQAVKLNVTEVMFGPV
jgi:hypothetical protein